jgi:L-rhamnose-H+ transport protein
MGAPALWQNAPVFIVILAGGFVTNLIWCVWLAVRNGTAGEIVRRDTPLVRNVLLCALGGATWYGQFLFYGMGTTLMGRYDFSSWTVHMAFIIVFSNVWALLLREWRGTSFGTRRLVLGGIAVLTLSTVVIGVGNVVASRG